MALVKCSECGREISDRAPACIYCGCPISEVRTHSNMQQVCDAAQAQQGTAVNSAPMRRARRQQAMNVPAAAEHATHPPIQQTAENHVVRPTPVVRQMPAENTVRQTVTVNGDVRQIFSSVTPDKQGTAENTAEAFIRNALKNPSDQKRVAAFKKKRRNRLLMNLVWPVLFLLGMVSIRIWPSMPVPVVVLVALLIYPAIGSIISIIASLIGTKTDKSIKHLEARGLLGMALREKEGESHTPFGDYGVLSDHFVFRKKGPGIIIACDDIVWVYTSYFRRYYSLMLGTKHLGKVTLSGVSKHKRNYKQQLNEAAAELKRRNPAILIGDTAENRAKYKAMTGK